LKVSSILQSTRNLVRSTILAMLTLLMMGIAIRSAHAGMIDHIEIRPAGAEAEIRILFVTQIRYLRQASLKNGDIRLYFQLLGIDALDTRLVPEKTESPPSELIPHFTISYPELDSSLSLSFGKSVDYHVRPGKDGRSISIFTPVIKPKNEPSKAAKVAPAIVVATPAIILPAVVPSVPLPSDSGGTAPRQAEQTVPPPPDSASIAPLTPPRPVAEIEDEAQQLMGSARYALQNDRAEAAIGSLNKLLNLPPNLHSQSAQELIGEAWEKNGEFDKARVEYQLYLKLYPKAADIRQVKERLANLPAKNAPKPIQVAAEKPKFAEEKMTVYGGFSQYYYRGSSHTDSLLMNGAASTSSSFTRTDQSQLLSMLDITGRKRTESIDTRIVFRDNHNANFLPEQHSYNRIDTFYLEQNTRDHSYLYRLGRQMGVGGGAPGRFDGAMAAYSFNPMWRVGGVVGVPVEFSTGSKKSFYGVNIDLTRLPEQWSSSGYFIRQQVDGFVDRRALGVDAHYFDAQRNFMGLLEYDTIFKKFNLGLLQGNWTTETSTNYNILLDRRRSPPLQLTNALIGQPVQSIAQLLQSGVSLKTMRSDAIALSPISNMFAVGLNRPYSSRWRIGADFRVNNMSGTDATSTGQPATAGSGNTYSYSVQATGNGLFVENDYGVVNATYTTSKTYKGQSLSFTQVETLRQNWRVDMLLLFYYQTDVLGTHQSQIRPSLKLNYRVNDSVNLEGEGGIEQIHTSSATQDDKTRRKYFYVGYRWDFQ
jgi:tetratricopeptide (TPR) repeat protein